MQSTSANAVNIPLRLQKIKDLVREPAYFSVCFVWHSLIYCNLYQLDLLARPENTHFVD